VGTSVFTPALAKEALQASTLANSSEDEFSRVLKFGLKNIFTPSLFNKLMLVNNYPDALMQ
jgi:hypothetical protein